MSVTPSGKPVLGEPWRNVPLWRQDQNYQAKPQMSSVMLPEHEYSAKTLPSTSSSSIKNDHHADKDEIVEGLGGPSVQACVFQSRSGLRRNEQPVLKSQHGQRPPIFEITSPVFDECHCSAAAGCVRAGGTCREGIITIQSRKQPWFSNLETKWHGNTIHYVDTEGGQEQSSAFKFVIVPARYLDHVL